MGGGVMGEGSLRGSWGRGHGGGVIYRWMNGVYKSTAQVLTLVRNCHENHCYLNVGVAHHLHGYHFKCRKVFCT